MKAFCVDVLPDEGGSPSRRLVWAVHETDAMVQALAADGGYADPIGPGVPTDGQIELARTYCDVQGEWIDRRVLNGLIESLRRLSAGLRDHGRAERLDHGGSVPSIAEIYAGHLDDAVAESIARLEASR